jgi:membrane-associated phospholipid phosphatase
VRRAFITVGLLVFWALPTEAQSPNPSETSTTASEQSDSSLGSLFTTLGHDFARLPSKKNFVILGIGGAMALAVHPADRELTARATGSDPLEDLFEVGSAAGNGWVHMGAALGTYVLGRGTGHEHMQIFGADLLRAQTVNGVMTQGIKLAVRRARPDQGQYSFPSGHASATFATATVLQRHFGWKVGIPAFGVATYVAGSRLQENQHYASDVIFGAAIGIVAGRTVKVGRGPGQFVVSPMAVPGGAGVTFERVP